MTFVLWKKFVSHTKHTNQPSDIHYLLLQCPFFFNVHLLLFEFVEIIITQIKQVLSRWPYLAPSLACVTDIVTPGVGDLDVGGVVDLIREAVCTLVPGLCKLTLGCLTMGRAVRDLGPANAEAAAIAPETTNNISTLFLTETDSNCQ